MSRHVALTMHVGHGYVRTGDAGSPARRPHPPPLPPRAKAAHTRMIRMPIAAQLLTVGTGPRLGAPLGFVGARGGRLGEG